MMKKLLFALLPILLVVALTSCEKDSDTPPPPPEKETQKVDNVDGVNDILNDIVASPDNKPVDVTVTKPVTSPETITIPSDMVVETTPSLSFAFEQPASAKVTIADAATTNETLYKGDVSVSIVQGTDIEINMPGATVYLNGTKVANVTAATAENTFVVAADSKITATLTVAKGNIDLHGEVNAIVRSQDNSDATTIVNLFPGAKLTTTPSDEKIVVKNILAGIHNITKDKYYESVKDAVLAASADDVIELTAGDYPLTVDPAKVRLNQDEYLRIDKNLTIKGVGNVVIYGQTVIGSSQEPVWGGNLYSQSTIFVDNNSKVTFENITFMPHVNEYYDRNTNKTIEILAGSRVEALNCKFVPNTKVNGKTTAGGSLYFAQSTFSAVGCLFDNASFTVDGLMTGELKVDKCTFDKGFISTVNWTPNVVANSTMVINVSNSTFKNTAVAQVAENRIINAQFGTINLTNNTFPTTNGVYWQAIGYGKITINGTAVKTNYLLSDWFNSRTKPDESTGKSVKGSNFVTVVTNGANVQNYSAWQGYSTHTSAPLQTTWSVSADLTLTAAEIGGEVAITMWTDVHPNGFKTTAPNKQGQWPVMGYVKNDKGIGWCEFNFEESATWQGQWTLLKGDVAAGTYRLKMECVGGKTINYYVDGAKIGTRTLEFDASYTDEAVVSSLPYELVFTSRDYTAVPYTSKWTNIVVN